MPLARIDHYGWLNVRLGHYHLHGWGWHVSVMRNNAAWMAKFGKQRVKIWRCLWYVTPRNDGPFNIQINLA